MRRTKMRRRLSFALATVIAASATVFGVGTTLGINFGDVIVQCLTGGASVRADYTINTVAADATGVAERLTRLSDSALVSSRSYTIPSGNTVGGWVFAGRTKTFDGSFQTSGLADGDYRLEVCATQAGSNGNPAKMTCQTIDIVVNCAEVATNPCANAAPFGEVVGRPTITDQATVQILVSGDFGPTALFTIEKGGIVIGSASISRAGDSCNYHANWKFTNGSGADLYGNDGPGVYSITVTGDGNELVFSETLVAPVNATND
jgi:hypothetical protein